MPASNGSEASWDHHGPLLDPIIHAAERAGALWLEADKKNLEAFLEPLADDDANKIVSAIAAHINLNGLAGMMAPALRNALVGAEPTLDGMINANIEGGFDQLEALLDGLAKTANPDLEPAPPAEVVAPPVAAEPQPVEAVAPAPAVEPVTVEESPAAQAEASEPPAGESPVSTGP